MRPNVSIATIDAATVDVMARGIRLFETHRFADTDAGQVKLFHKSLAPEPGSLVLDAGCGIGEVSRLMAELDPSLRFVMANISSIQIRHAPAGPRFHAVLADLHDLPVAMGCIDAAIYASALCQLDTLPALREAARVIRPGGRLLIVDMVRDAGDGWEMEALLGARVLRRAELERHVGRAGFRIDRSFIPAGDSDHFQAMLDEAALGHLLRGVAPIVIAATRSSSLGTETTP